MPPLKSKVRLSKRGAVNIPLHMLEKAGIERGSSVWIVSDGDILIIKSVFQRPRSTYSPIIKHLRGVFKRLMFG